MNSPCQAYLIVDRDSAQAVQCELPLHHKKDHVATTIWTSVGERPRGGKARRDTTVTLRWR